jgi:two-component system, sensor histidine kinase and response regulator
MSAPLESTPLQPMVDRRVALSRVGGDIELLKEIAVLFLDTYPEVLQEIRNATERGDAQMLEQSAHGLKGSVANFGAAAAVEAALVLENMGRTRQLKEATQGLRNLELALSALRPELEALD